MMPALLCRHDAAPPVAAAIDADPPSISPPCCHAAAADAIMREPLRRHYRPYAAPRFDRYAILIISIIFAAVADADTFHQPYCTRAEHSAMRRVARCAEAAQKRCAMRAPRGSRGVAMRRVIATPPRVGYATPPVTHYATPWSRPRYYRRRPATSIVACCRRSRIICSLPFAEPLFAVKIRKIRRHHNA